MIDCANNRIYEYNLAPGGYRGDTTAAMPVKYQLTMPST